VGGEDVSKQKPDPEGQPLNPSFTCESLYRTGTILGFDASPRDHSLDYDPRWPELYEEERGVVMATVGSMVRSIEHIGSTSSPGWGRSPS